MSDEWRAAVGDERSVLSRSKFAARLASLLAHRSSLVARLASLVAHRSSLVAHQRSLGSPAWRQAGWIVAAVCALGASAVVTQLALMRELLGAFCGNELVLGVILGNWLLLTGLGAWIGRSTGRLGNPVAALVGSQLLVALLPVGQVLVVRTLRNVVFVRGATVGLTETVLASFVLLLPYCLVSGYMLTLACSILADLSAARRSADPAAGIGRVYVADSVGSIVGGLFFILGFTFLGRFDHFAALYAVAAANLVVAGWVAWRFGKKILLAVTAGATAGLGLLVLAGDLDAVSTAVQYPGRQIAFRGDSPYGRLVVTESAGQFDFIENGLPVISTHNVEQVEETVHYAMAQTRGPARVLLIGGGVSGTANEVLKYGVAEVTYVELDPMIIEVGRRFLPDSLADPRIRVVATDGRLFIRQTTDRFDAVIVDVPDPSTFQLNRFYTAEFFAEARRTLNPDGVLSISLGLYADSVSAESADLLSSAWRTLKSAFRNVLVIPGGRNFLLASDGPLSGEIAARIEQRRIATQWVKRSYLDATLTPDRMAAVARATSQPAELNRDLDPKLYYYHLRQWISQFRVRFGVLEGALLALLAVYLLGIRPAPLAIFASGFAATALEVVLLLGFQVLCGSVYHQVGLVVTAFMAGLAVGAFAANRLWRGAGRKSLAGLQFAVAAYALLLPAALLGLGRLGGSAASVLAIQAAVGLMTFVLAMLVGAQFPLAGRIEYSGAAPTASRLYTADFVGACLGALLASTLLIPLFGALAACLATATLCAVGGAVVRFSRG